MSARRRLLSPALGGAPYRPGSVAFGRVNGLARELSFHRFAKPDETGILIPPFEMAFFSRNRFFPLTPLLSAAHRKKLRGCREIFFKFLFYLGGASCFSGLGMITIYAFVFVQTGYLEQQVPTATQQKS